MKIGYVKSTYKEWNYNNFNKIYIEKYYAFYSSTITFNDIGFRIVR